MGSVEDHRVKAAKELLELRLREVFDETSTACRNRLEELGDPPVIGEGIFGGLGTEGDYVVRDFIKRWKERVADCITKVFESFAEAQQPHGDENHPGDMAKQLTWETIDQVFHWTSDDRNSSTCVKEWLSRAAYPEPPSVLGNLPREYGWQAQTADQLKRDFCTQFELLLSQLRNEAILNTPAAHSTRPADSSDSNANGMQSGFAHSDDYRAVTVGDKQYTLTPNQALVIRALHEASVKGIQALSTAALRQSVGGHRSRIRDSFRSGDGRKLWKKFVVQTRKGMYALKLPGRR